MLRTQLACGGPCRFAVLHGVRHSWDLGYRSELMTLRRMYSNFTYVPIINRPKEEAAVLGGETLVENACRSVRGKSKSH